MLGQAVLASTEDFAADLLGVPGAGYFDERCQAVLDLAERYADKLATEQDLQAAHAVAARENASANELLELAFTSGAPGWVQMAAQAATAVTAAAAHAAATEVNAADAAVAAAAFIGDIAGAWAAKETESAVAAREAFVMAERKEWGEQCDLFRDLFWSSFCPVGLAAVGRTLAVVALARTIYEERAFERLPILGDALEDAGIGEAVILAHCREPGVHVRGCWVVDLVLDKE